MCHSDSASTSYTYLPCKKSKYISDASTTYHWIIETAANDNTTWISSRPCFLDETHTTWIHNEILVRRKYKGESPKHNEKLIKANFMKSIQNRRKELPKRIYIKNFAQNWGILR